MKILHAHYSPEQPGLFFWAETSEMAEPRPSRGRTAQNPRPKPHPFNIPPELNGEVSQVTLRLPTVKGIPIPSPQLVHSWDLLMDDPVLSPFTIEGIFLPPEEAISVLLSHFHPDAQTTFIPSPSLQYWSMAASLVLEALAAHKLIPVMTGQNAHWLPVLDSPRDSARLTQLTALMPAVCRAIFSPAPSGQIIEMSPRSLLTQFLNSFCDTLARSWGKPCAPIFSRSDDPRLSGWIEALFNKKPTINLPASQIQSLASSLRAWIRNLHAAGDATFRIAFRLEAPPTAQESWQLNYLIQAKDDPSLIIPAEEIWNNTQGTLTHIGRRFDQPQEKLLAGLGYAARLFPPIVESLKNKRPTQLTVDTAGAYNFLRETAPLLEGSGFGILIPPWWNKKGARLGAKVKMKSQKDVGSPGRMSMKKLVEYQWKLSIGETELSEEEFKALAQLKSPLVQIRGQWVTLDADQIEAAIKFWDKQKLNGEMTLLEAMRLGLGGETTTSGLPIDTIETDGWFSDWLGRFSQSEKLEELPQPLGLVAQLRPYQKYGFSWLSFLRSYGLGACLADDMGLGKTLQTISLLVHEKEQQGKYSLPVLLIAPTSVVTNWVKEIQRFAPRLTTYIHRGAERLSGKLFAEAIQNQDVVLTSYPIARLDAEIFQSTSWLALILDEAQNIKNPETKQTQAIRKIDAEFRIALTGTPVENRLSELWSIMHFLNPGYLGSRKSFRQNFALPIERYNDQVALAQLKKLTSPFILRRVKSDPRVISDLPDKVETKVYCSLTEEQATLYEAVVQNAMKRIESEDGIQRRGLVLSMLMQLKQICNHPVQYLHQSSGTGIDSAMEKRSGKLERLCELLEEAISEGNHTLIFTQFAEMGELLANYLPRSIGAATQFLHGGTSVKSRDQMVKRFQEDTNGPKVFILSLKAGGTGLNLTRANHVFHFDRWWNPAVEDQATDRAFRIGQKRSVQVHKFVTTGTLEEMIDEMIESKKGLAQAVIGNGENWLTEMSTDDLRKAVSLRRD